MQAVLSAADMGWDPEGLEVMHTMFIRIILIQSKVSITPRSCFAVSCVTKEPWDFAL